MVIDAAMAIPATSERLIVALDVPDLDQAVVPILPRPYKGATPL